MLYSYNEMLYSNKINYIPQNMDESHRFHVEQRKAEMKSIILCGFYPIQEQTKIIYILKSQNSGYCVRRDSKKHSGMMEMVCIFIWEQVYTHVNICQTMHLRFIHSICELHFNFKIMSALLKYTGAFLDFQFTSQNLPSD